jgi:hypothetical protein
MGTQPNIILDFSARSPITSVVGNCLICYTFHVLGQLAQLARASRLHREGRGFESLIAHQIKNPPLRWFFDLVRASAWFLLNKLKNKNRGGLAA